MGSGALPVFGTPYMSALMENAAHDLPAVLPGGGPWQRGHHIDITHDAPTPVGMKVWAEAEITAVSENGKMVDFAVKAWDEKGPIGAGTHTRAIIKNEKFPSPSATPSWKAESFLTAPQVASTALFSCRNLLWAAVFGFSAS